MSFLKIKDPAKRDAIVKEYLDLKKNIRSNLLSERTGEMEMQTDLSKSFKPITETQKTTAKEITEELKPIKEGVEKLPNSILIPAFPAIQATSEPTEREDVHYVNELALEYLMKYMSNEADRTFGIKTKDRKLIIGDSNIMIDGSDIEVLDSDGKVKEKYKGTRGLWSLIVDKTPREYDYEDLDNYKDLLKKTNAMYRGADPNKPTPAATTGTKFNLIKTFWEEEKKKERGT